MITMVNTDREMLKVLCKQIVTRLENQKSIAMKVTDRQAVLDEVFEIVSKMVFTEEDVREETIKSIGARHEDLSDVTFTESQRFKEARRAVRKELGDDSLNGFYFVSPPKTVAQKLCEFLMNSPQIEEVFEDDRDLEQKIVDVFKKFNPKNIH